MVLKRLQILSEIVLSLNYLGGGLGELRRSRSEELSKDQRLLGRKVGRRQKTQKQKRK